MYQNQNDDDDDNSPDRQAHQEQATVTASNFERITPQNAQQILSLLFPLSFQLSQHITPEEAMQNPMALVAAGSPEHEVSDLYPERVYSSHLFYQALQSLFPQAPTPNVYLEQTPDEISNATTEYLYGLGEWSELWQAFKKMLETFPGIEPFFLDGIKLLELFFAREWVNVLTFEERKRHDELHEMLFGKNCECDPEIRSTFFKEYNVIENKVKPLKRQWEADCREGLEKFKASMLSMKNEEHAAVFEDYSDFLLYESVNRLRGELPRLSKLSAREIREYLARYHGSSTFAHLVLEDVNASAVVNNAQETTTALDIFNRMIRDFIRTDSQGLWSFTPDRNFSLNTLRSSQANSLLDADDPRKEVADAVVDHLEGLLDELEIIFSSKSPASSHEPRWMLEHSVIWECHSQLVELFLVDDPESEFSHRHYGYTATNPLVEEMRKRFFELENHINDAWENDSYEKILRDIEMFPFVVVRKIYQGPDILNQSYKDARRALRTMRFTQTPKFREVVQILRARCRYSYRAWRDLKNLHNSYEHRKLLLPTVEQAIDIKIQKLLKPFRKLVADLIQQRTGNGDFSAVLCIGFKGPAFNQVNFSGDKTNKVYLAFSSSGCTAWHHFLLTKLRAQIYQHRFSGVGDLTAKVVSNTGIIFSGEKTDLTRLPSREFDPIVYSYMLKQILKILLCEKDSDVHPDLKAAWKRSIKEIIDVFDQKDDPALRQSQKNKFLQEIIAAGGKEHFKLCVDNGIEDNSVFKLLCDLALAYQHFSCAETSLSKYAHVNLYIPLTFQAAHKESVGHAGTQAGKQRHVIPPCQRCCLLSAPYLLWATLIKGWGLGDMNLAAKRHGQQPIEPSFSRDTGSRAAATVARRSGSPLHHLPEQDNYQTGDEVQQTSSSSSSTSTYPARK